jgi:Tol biopolymer transport system component
MRWALLAAVLFLPAVFAGAGSARIADASPQVYSVDVRTGALTQLTDSGSNREPSYSPDGRAIAFDCAPASLCTMRPNGSGRKVLVSFPGFFSVSEPVWSRDGARIAFAAARPCEVASCTIYSLYVVGRDGGGLHPIASPARAPSWSPDSRRLVFEAGIDFDGVSHELRTARVDGTPLTRLARGNGVWEPRWSPAGRWIAYSAGTVDESFGVDNRSVWVETLATGRRRRLGTGHDPVWSSRETIAFTRWPRTGLYIFRPDGPVRRLAITALRPAWSADGRKIAYWRRLALVVSSPSGKENRVVARFANTEEGPGSRPSWAPDGRTIVTSGIP